MDSILVTGSTGLAASKILQRSRGGDILVQLLGRNWPLDGMLSSAPFHEADLLDRDAIMDAVRRSKALYIIHTAAMTDVDGCEREPDLAWQINVEGTRHVAEAAAALGLHLVFVSTDYVFSGEHGPYRETDAVDPRSVYGKTKLAAEQIIAELCPSAAIARTSTLYGYSPGVRPNFVTWLVGQLREKKPVTIVTDQISSPTLAENLAEMLLMLSAKRSSGVYHTVGGEWMSRFDFALAVADAFNLDRSLINPCVTADLHQLAPRPAHSGLIVDKIRTLDAEPMSVKEALGSMQRQMEKVRV